MKRVKVYLEVPFSEKNQAKNLGAWWDPGEKKWFVPEGADVDCFKKWIPAECSELSKAEAGSEIL